MLRRNFSKKGFSVALTNAERQKRFRDRQRLGRQSGGSNRVRLGGYVATVSAQRLKSLAAYFGKSQQAVVEMLIDAADQRVMERLRKNLDGRLLTAYVQAGLKQDGSIDETTTKHK